MSMNPADTIRLHEAERQLIDARTQLGVTKDRLERAKGYLDRLRECTEGIILAATDGYGFADAVESFRDLVQESRNAKL